MAEDLWQDGSFVGGDIIERPKVLGIERLDADGLAIRLVVKTDPSDQWAVARELRLRIKEALDAAKVTDRAMPRAPKPPVAAETDRS